VIWGEVEILKANGPFQSASALEGGLPASVSSPSSEIDRTVCATFRAFLLFCFGVFKLCIQHSALLWK
jgi:hypothetical protein